MISEHASEFLKNYQADTARRWSAEDLAAQQAFVNGHIAGADWMDWSNPTSALQLIQAGLLGVAMEETTRHDVIVLAGPVVELLEPGRVFELAARRLKPRGQLVGIAPCLRDNSPESQLFMDLSARRLWPYFVADELTELLEECGFEPDRTHSSFPAIPRFNRAVLDDELEFKGFRMIFDEMAAQGYDPIEVGWGELRFAASLKDAAE